MKKPDFDGRVLAEALYNVGSVEKKVSSPPEKCNLYGRPSLIPGIKYPISEREEKLLDKAWNHFCNLKNRGLV